jgi:hypothetical protein
MEVYSQHGPRNGVHGAFTEIAGINTPIVGANLTLERAGRDRSVSN